MEVYKTKGTCSREIKYDIIDGVVRNVQYIGGCKGNLQGISKLVEGRTPQEVIDALEGIQCRNGTSCPDQLAQALKDKLSNN